MSAIGALRLQFVPAARSHSREDCVLRERTTESWTYRYICKLRLSDSESERAVQELDRSSDMEVNIRTNMET